MNQPLLPGDNPQFIPETSIWQQAENSTLGGGMQAVIGDNNIQIQGNSNFVTFNKTEILQISVDEIKTRKFIEVSPYRGLKKFEPEDKDLFFGRDQFLANLVNELEQTNLVLLSGASGSGKSSVVRAGLIPWLFQKYGMRLVSLIFTPDQDPFESLYASLLTKNPQNEAQFAREAKANTLTQVIARLKQADDYWLIFIDQFEEIFTTSEAEKRDRFIKSLVQLASSKPPSVKIIATMRADFLDKLSPYPAFVKATDKHRPMIAEMQLDELRLAIEQPAAHHGVVFETGLVEEIIKDVKGQAGYLPLLQYTLNLLWETEVKTGSIKDRTLNTSTYRELGGVRGALQQRVDKIYEDLSAQEKIVTQRIFLKLVDIGGNKDSGTEWKPVRRRTLRSEFNDSLEQSVLIKLINNNLLVSDSPAEMLHERKVQSQQSTVEIAHETLLTSWMTLNSWIKENRQNIALRNRLNDDVARWRAKKAEDELWTGSKLEKVLELRKDTTFNQVLGGFGETANQFIEHSLGLRDRRRRRTIIGLTGFSGVALFLAGIALWQWRQAEITKSETLIRTSDLLFTQGKEFDALIESLRAGVLLQRLKVKPPIQMVNVLRQAVYEVKERNRLEGSVTSVVFSPDRKTIATVNSENTLQLWNFQGQPLVSLTGDLVVFSPDNKTIATCNKDKVVLWNLQGELLHSLNKHSCWSRKVIFSSDGAVIATRNDAGTVQLWNPKGQLLNTLSGHYKEDGSVVFSPDSTTIATASDDGKIRLWNLKGQLLTSFNSGYTETVLFSPDSKVIATYSRLDKNGIVRLWNLQGQLVTTLTNHSGGNNTVVFSPDSKIIATSSDENKILLWNLQGQLVTTLTGHRASVTSIVFSPDGKNIATSSQDKTAKLWNLQGKLIYTLGEHPAWVWNVVFSPDGKTIATVGADKTVYLWNMKGQALYTLTGHRGDIREVAFAPDATIATSDSDGTVKLWRGKLSNAIKADKEFIFSPDSKIIATKDSYSPVINLWNVQGEHLYSLAGDHSDIIRISFNLDGTIIATGSRDGKVSLWNMQGKLLRTFTAHNDYVSSIAFSPDGNTIVTGSSDKTAHLWNVQGKLLHTLTGHIKPVENVAFSLDGKTIITYAGNSTDDKIRLWDLQGHLFKTLTGHLEDVSTIVFSPDRQTIAFAAGYGKVGLWNLQGQKLTFTAHGDPSGLGYDAVPSIAFSPDNKTILTGGYDKTAKLWNLKGKLIRTFIGHSEAVSSVAFSPDGKTIATGSHDGTIHLWDLQGQLLTTFTGNQSIQQLVFSPDGRTIASSRSGFTVSLWNLDFDDLLARGCNWVRDYLKYNPNARDDRSLCDGIGSPQ